MSVKATRDAFVGLDNPTAEQWQAWYRALRKERDTVLSRAAFDPTIYDDASTAWSDTTFRQLFLFMYDAGFYDRESKRYRADALCDHWAKAFGRVDEVLLWHAYPRLGFDKRTQFDFYRDMPGGIEALRKEVTDVLHARGIRVFVDYNPWDAGTYEELAAIVHGLDADGVMLDTMTELPGELASAVRKKKSGVVFAPELRVRDEDLRHVRQSWAQWFEIGDATTPSIYRQQWLERRHRQFAIARWDTSRKRDIVYSFFNGAGLILWENIFGTWNPYSSQDRRLLQETSVILDHYGDLFARGEWLPLIPTGVTGLDANRFEMGDRAIVTLRNRTQQRLHYRLPNDGFAFWGDRHDAMAGDTIAIEPEGVQTFVEDDPETARRALARFGSIAQPSEEERCPKPYAIVAPSSPSTLTHEARMIDLPGGTFPMRIVHERRECGCYPDGATDDAKWGWFYKDILTHERALALAPFAIRKTAVTNAEFLAFVHATKYRPNDDGHFLAQLTQPDGSLPTTLSEPQASLPVTYVSLADARAFAAAYGERLPTEAEWQWAAEGPHRGHRYPWGHNDRAFPHELRPAHDKTTSTREGVMGLSGNAWELTESEHTDGHTRFVMLRGGVYLPQGESEWLPMRGARPNDWHAKYILLADALDRSATISFRTVRG